MLPYLIIGGSRETFWKLNPKSIKIDFEAYNYKVRIQKHNAWEQGLYFKWAIASSVFACGLVDNKTKNGLPKYPDEPRIEEETEQSQEVQRELLIAKMAKWARMNNKK